MDEELLEKLKEAIGSKPGNPNVWDGLSIPSAVPLQQPQSQPAGLFGFVRNPTARDIEKIAQGDLLESLGLWNQPKLRRGEQFMCKVHALTPTRFETEEIIQLSGRFSPHRLYSRALLQYDDFIACPVTFSVNPDGGGLRLVLGRFFKGDTKEQRRITRNTYWTFELDAPLGRLAGRAHLVCGF